MNLICINCPRGCHLTIEKTSEGFEVTGNACPRGETYAVSEMTNPLRTLTTTIPVGSRTAYRLPVMTSSPIPKARQNDVIRLLKDVSVNAPVARGEIIVKDVLGLGSDIVSCKTIDQ